jgi:nucleoside-diphosphate-sugar epimerase
MNNVLITGSSGFVGKALISELQKENISAQGIDIADGFDITDFSTLEKLADIDCIVHLAAKSFVPDSFIKPLDFYQTNISGTLNVLELARKHNASVIFFSSYLYGAPEYLPVNEEHRLDPHNPYAQSKLISESLCHAYHRDFGVPVIIFRPFNIYGKNQNSDFLIPTIIKQCESGLIRLKDSRPKRDYIHVSDVAKAICLAIKRQNSNLEIFNLGTGTSFSVKEIVELIINNFAKVIKVEYDNEQRKNEVLDCYADITKMKNYFGWAPQISLEEGLKRILNKE